ncbi:uncharacterized protein F5147DRAFT_587901 [Suillus discolor]|uniref:Uncharacterized protein n=1 Tax=Suillus discolor TaxID=1912936 RepID=A0A9P7JM41_9AGAM|nr:uncharacterized protein F5147DRAFT_587901 [Suillus discolor]KAG2087907.1 hypothetical protein F5147DRAFT_587901 [Suillus discolor]
MSQVEGGSQPSATPEASKSAATSLAATSSAVVTSDSAQQRQKIALLEEKLQVLESGHWLTMIATGRETNYFMSQGRAIRRTVSLFDNVEDLITENDRRCDNGDDEVTIDQDHLQMGYIILNNFLPWFHPKCSAMEYEDSVQMLKKLRQGADSARGDDTSKLKSLVPDWVNCAFKPNPPVDHEDKYSRGFVNDTCGKLLCPTELDWNNPTIRAGIRDRTDGYIVTEMSWPTFLYERYTADENNLEEGLFKSALLVQAFKSIFTSPSSAKEIDSEGDGADIIENNRHAKRQFSGKKVKTHLRFALSSVTSWCSVDGDFDYVQFWYHIVDFFEKAPGRVAQQKVDRLLAWWTRKVFGTSHCAELSDAAKSSMSVNALARQRVQEDDALFDSE